ncbi:hypothetical protein HFK74_29805|uniref:fibronectin type III domain-containing protein n=1 Tax=Pseudomonas sp. SbOxS1 TaxID=2723884 RepID=UPI0015D0DFDF|nr:fibronectin type III domain-containing protein [Pseudomonas sp. SbOxS1]NYU06901.1 hypothetical protein [Pseudomonas sp. SbOxS1]
MPSTSTVLECPDVIDGVLDCRHRLTAALVQVVSWAELAVGKNATLTCSGILVDGSESRLQLHEVESLDEASRKDELRFEIPLHYLNSLSDKSTLQIALLTDDVQTISSAVFNVLTLAQPSGMLAPTALQALYFDSHSPTSFRVVFTYYYPYIRFVFECWREYPSPVLIGEYESVAKAYTITGLQPQTRYYILARVVTSGGELDYRQAWVDTRPGAERPAAPTDLSARSSSYTVELTWRASALATGYRVKYGLHPNGPVINTLPFTTTTATIGGLSSGTAYYFELWAFNAAGESPSIPTTATTLTVPVSPLNLRASPAINTMDLTWSASAGANRYIIHYGVEPGGAIQNVTVYSTSHQLTGLSKNTLYAIFVSAANSNGASLPTPITQKTLDGPPIPSTPSVGYAEVKFDTIQLVWNMPTEPEYTVTHGLAEKWPEAIETQSTKYLNYTVKNLAPDTLYFLEVRAVNASGCSEPRYIERRTGSDTTQPRNLRVPGRTFCEAWLTWDAPADPSYLIYYEITCTGRASVTTTETNYIATGLKPEVEYQFQVLGRRNGGPFPALPLSTKVVTHDREPPTRPRNLKLTAPTQGNATLEWRASEDNVGVTGYQTRRNGGAWVPVSGTSHPVTGLIEGVVVRFEVRARDAAGNWSIPTGVSSKRPGAPSAPQNFRYSQSGLISILEWDAPIDMIDLTSYQIVLTGPQGGELPYSSHDPILKPLLLSRTRYGVRITARNAVGESLPLIAEMTTK